MTYEGKNSLLERGKALMEQFCAANSLSVPSVVEADPKRWPHGVCAYYRAEVITINVKACAGIGFAGMQWSFPGHSVDRTPYGVIAHELGHHVDLNRAQTRRGRYWGDFSCRVRDESGEDKLTSYCPDSAEWFAEMFRLFITNPDLLAKLRPRTHAILLDHGFKPVFQDGWRERLVGAPDRTILSIERKLAERPKMRKAKPQENQHQLF